MTLTLSTLVFKPQQLQGSEVVGNKMSRELEMKLHKMQKAVGSDRSGRVVSDSNPPNPLGGPLKENPGLRGLSRNWQQQLWKQQLWPQQLWQQAALTAAALAPAALPSRSSGSTSSSGRSSSGFKQL